MASALVLRRALYVLASLLPVWVLIAYVWKYSRAERAADGRWLRQRGSRALPFAVPPAVLLALYLGVHFGSFAAAGSDSYGYVSQARLWLSGIPRVEQAWVQDFPWPNREWMFSPLGYRPFSPDGTIVPTYPAGLPLAMALFLVFLTHLMVPMSACRLPQDGRWQRC